MTAGGMWKYQQSGNDYFTLYFMCLCFSDETQRTKSPSLPKGKSIIQNTSDT